MSTLHHKIHNSRGRAAFMRALRHSRRRYSRGRRKPRRRCMR